MCDIGTIPSIHARLREEGYPISLCTLRGWVRNGFPVLPARRKMETAMKL